MPASALVRAAGRVFPARRAAAAHAPMSLELLEKRVVLSANAALFDTNELVDFSGAGTIIDLEIGDLNGDGVSDFIATDRSQVYIILSSRGGYLPVTTLNPTTATADAIQLADVQSDGDLDIVFADTNGAGQIGVFRNDGFGNFAPVAFEPNTSETDIRDFVVTDFNRDGNPDVALITEDSYQVRSGNDGGALAAGVITTSTGSNRDFRAVRAADMNGDGTLDLVTQEYVNNVFFRLGVLPFFASGTNGQFNRDIALTTSALTGFELLDLNNDGTIDQVAAVRADNAQLWHSENLTTGSTPDFDEPNEQSVSSILTGSGSEVLTSADLNGDGADDLLLTSSNGSAIQIFYAAPSQFHGGLYETRTSLNVGGESDILRTADIDDDGDIDLIRLDGTQIFIHRNLGGGIFASAEGSIVPGQTLSTPDISPRGVAYGDLDNDGITDAVIFETFNNDPKLAVAYGSSIGRFTGQPTLTASTMTSIDEIAILDTDGDGDNDIVVLGDDNSDSYVQVFRNDGIDTGSSGSSVRLFTRLDAGRIAGTTLFVQGIWSGPLDNDGLDDVVIGDGNNNRIIVLSGTPTGAMTLIGRFGVGNDVAALDVADIDGDGDNDVVLATDTGISVLIEEGRFNYDAIYSRFIEGGARAVAAANFNPDALPDVAAIVGDGYGDLMFFRNRSPGSDAPVLKPITSTVFPIYGADIDRLDAADLDGDGDLDLGLIGSFSPAFFIVLSDGFLGVESSSYYERFGAFGSLRGGALFDADGDGDADHVALETSGDASLRVAHNAGDGTFNVGDSPTFNFTRVGVLPGEVAAHTTLGNFNGNARPELATLEFDEDTFLASVVIHLPTPQGFQRLAQVELGFFASERILEAADVNGDGRDDLVVYNTTEDRFYTLLNTGNGSTWSVIAAHSQVDDLDYRYLALGDLTGDGIVDILGYDPSPPSTARGITVIMPGRGDGTFRNGAQRIEQFTSNIFPNVEHPPRIVDFDGDGLNDIIYGDGYGSGAVFLRQQTSPGTFGNDTLLLGTGQDPAALSIADVNNDGRPDILVGMESTNAYHIVFNTSTPGTPEWNFVTFSTDGFRADTTLLGGDIDNDGRVELVAVGGGGITIIELNVAGAAISRTKILHQADRFEPAYLADLNRDGTLDIAFSPSQSLSVDSLVVLENRPAAKPAYTNSLPVIPTGTIHLGDLDAFADPLALSFRRLRNLADAFDADGDRIQGFRITEIVDAELSGKGGIVNGGRYFVFGETIDYVLTSTGLATAFRVTLFDGKRESVAIFDVTYNGTFGAVMPCSSAPDAVAPPPPPPTNTPAWLEPSEQGWGLFDNEEAPFWLDQPIASPRP